MQPTVQISYHLHLPSSGQRMPNTFVSGSKRIKQWGMAYGSPQELRPQSGAWPHFHVLSVTPWG